ncbi:MAG: hypothetical protein QXF01_00695 [Candidatus Micrarchaeaceae archaeon]
MLPWLACLWGALTAGVRQVNSSTAGTAIAVGEGATGLTMSITPPVEGGSCLFQAITTAPGLTETLPSKITSDGVAATGTWNNGRFTPTLFAFANGQKTILQ